MSDCPDCGCSDFEKCLKILNLILDNESTPAQEDFFFNHIENCMVCFAHYNAEKQIRRLIKMKTKSQIIPVDLAREIR
ncbi:MAG: hypothetical protein AAFY41_19440, partial [Bacteroidota bacterium]